jgi:(4S)-4-hydroxy-5-phosphonooxypentane-2,3-dione isomerase
VTYVVVAEFLVRTGEIERFLTHIRRHAAASRAEQGCRVFEVAQDVSDPQRVLLFERYDDEAAYLAHRATAHYSDFRGWAPPLLEQRDGDLFQRRSVLAAVM